MMREDNPATELMNSLSACLSACGMLCKMASEARARRDEILDGVSWFIEAAPLDELPTVRTFGGLTKEMMRTAADVAARLEPAVLAWDGMTDPPPSLASLAREFSGP